jgi:hypothetical protein
MAKKYGLKEGGKVAVVAGAVVSILGGCAAPSWNRVQINPSARDQPEKKIEYFLEPGNFKGYDVSAYGYCPGVEGEDGFYVVADRRDDNQNIVPPEGSVRIITAGKLEGIAKKCGPFDGKQIHTGKGPNDPESSEDYIAGWVLKDVASRFRSELYGERVGENIELYVRKMKYDIFWGIGDADGGGNGGGGNGGNGGGVGGTGGSGGSAGGSGVGGTGGSGGSGGG